MSVEARPRDETRAAVLAGVGCYVFWGLVPLVFQAMNATGASPTEIVAHRTFWTVFWAGALLLLTRQAPEARRLFGTPRLLLPLMLSTALITANWSVYVWAVVNSHTLEASLGYYITPLISMAGGALLFRERLDRFALIAVALAGVGVVLQALAIGRPPWIALALAATFGSYGIVRKHVQCEAHAAIFVESLLMAAPGAALIGWLQASGHSHFLATVPATVALLLTGPATLIPLALFGWAVKRMPLSSLGFLQFLGPTLTFFVGVDEGEPFGAAQAAAFAFIWTGAAVFAFGAWRRSRSRATPAAGSAAVAE